MSKFKHAALALAAAGLLSAQAQAQAGEAQGPSLQAMPVAAFSQSDVQGMFEQAGQPMEVAALSSAEMKDTEGASVPNVIGGGLGAVGYGTSCMFTRCTAAGFGMGFAAGFVNPVRGAGSAIWGFNADVGFGAAWGVGSRRGWW